MSAVPMMVLVSSLLAVEIAPWESLATLPIACIVMGTASGSIPAALLMRKLGRKRGGYLGFSFALLCCLAGYFAATRGSFVLLVLAGFSMGIASAFGQQFRFAALESVGDPAKYGPALSVFMGGGLVSAFLGPEIGVWGQNLVASGHNFAGSFLLQSGVVLLAAVLFSLFREPEMKEQKLVQATGSLGKIVASPAFLVAAFAATLSYVMMSFVMTATPLTMREVCGFSLSDTKQVIQGHIVAMYLPSLLSGWLMNRVGQGRLMLVGSVAYAGVLVIGLFGQELVHFWGALILLGIGWNFLFACGTALLPAAYEPHERFKAQAANDFTVFGFQAVASLSAGWFLFNFGWTTLLLFCAPLVLAAFALSVVQIKREKGTSQMSL
ncbi:MFS transporter [Pelagicoccus albus]|uniref:MFS transporter n=1 Tax=Pelagicoccus albus TaxID=415222 RepID=A0A7X1EAG3_9BACT|nr:MFS transporter [Pelagicoccus albus]MBC2606742.1 MFS transporter [Pelagicoccus albus]